MDSKSQDSSVHKQQFSAFRTDPDCPTWGEKIEVLAMKTLLTLTHLKLFLKLKAGQNLHF